ncbi:MAG: hypothetical protein AB7D96_10680 [Arcobacteraceae bacterium]
MGCYINETEAKTALVNIVKDFTTDHLIYVRKRVTKTPIKKAVTFAVVLVYEDSNEQIYNAFLKYELENNNETKVLQSETFLDNGKKKELFFVECLIGIKG